MEPLILSRGNKLGRILWGLAWLVLFRYTPTPFFWWRRAVLRVFGAKIGAGALPYPSVKIWAPWKLTMKDGSCLGPNVVCYCVGDIEIGEGVTVSQYSYLCTASHDYGTLDLPMPLLVAPIRIESHAWITTDVYIGPGVTIGKGAVVAARSSVVRDVAPWSIVAGNPAKKIGERRIDPKVSTVPGGIS